jgi:hypothetical protein
MRSSTLLKQTRLDKDLTIEDISQKIKIPKKYIVALETEDKKCFPDEPYCSLIIKDYADFLGLNGQNLVKLFRRDFDHRNVARKINNYSGLSITPQLTFKIGLLFALFCFLGYIFFEYQKFNSPPSLKVNWPQHISELSNTIDISGVTDTEATVRINNDLVLVNNNGLFSKKIKIDNLQKITVESQSPHGKKTTIEKKVQDLL